MAIDDIVDVVTVGNGFVSAARAVNMVCIVSTACVFWCTYVGVGCIDIERMLIDVVTMRVMEMAIMYIVDVVIVYNRGVPTLFVVHMCVVIVF